MAWEALVFIENDAECNDVVNLWTTKHVIVQWTMAASRQSKCIRFGEVLYYIRRDRSKFNLYQKR